MNHGDLENFILHTIERWYATRYTERHGIVSSYDPKKHLAKVVLQPSGQETGWLPIETGHIGKDYGILVGLQPGKGNQEEDSGKSQEGNQGDQVIVRFQEGDIESGKIAGRVHSSQDNPPEVKSGEIMLYARFQKSGGDTPDAAEGGQGGTGQQIYLKNDGSLFLTDGNGAKVNLDGKGNIELECNDLKFKVNGDWITDVAKVLTMIADQAGIKGNSVAEFTSGGVTGVDAAGGVTVQGGGDVSDGSVKPPSSQPTIPPFTVPS